MTETCKLKPRIFIALSGGVDSSVAASLLLEQGYDVETVFIRVWQADFLPCSQDAEEKAAKRVAAFLGVPFHVLDLSEEYKKDIVDSMIESYKKGETPNPDVLCNRYIKFGPFLKWAKERGANLIATGHHARIEETPEGKYRLLRGEDAEKDQAYFLWMLTQDDLQHTIMPIGGMQKSQVREYAREKSLPSARKSDSQGLCFIGDVHMKDFLAHFITLKEGDVLDTEGKKIGTHDGSILYTIGQRTGFRVNTKNTERPHYFVMDKDLEENTITVATQRESIDKHSTVTSVSLKEINWIEAQPDEKEVYECEIRYHGTRYPCRVAFKSDTEIEVLFEDTMEKVAQGQSVVIYKDSVCIGGGIAR